MARKKGASQAEASLNYTTGFSTAIRKQEVETVEYNRNKNLEVSIYFGQQKGSASTSDFSSKAIEETLEAACYIAQVTSQDPFNGLAEPIFLEKNPPRLDLYHPWLITPENAIEKGITCEKIALDLNKNLISEGISVSTHQSLHVYANSHGFLDGYPSSLHSISCQLIAKDKNSMQRDASYTVHRNAQQLKNVEILAEEAAKKTLSRLGAKHLKTSEAPVIFHSEVAPHLIKAFLSAISGENLYRKASFLENQIGQLVFDKKISIYEKPHVLGGLASLPFDLEGVRTYDRALVFQGILEGYLLNSYSARKLGLATTGNAGGPQNILLETSNLNFNDLVKKMGKGLLVTEVLGQGINLVTGDYSRGASGFWVENGKIEYPVEEITIAGNLKDMFQNIIAISNDLNLQSYIQTGSILVNNMMIAGTH